MLLGESIIWVKAKSVWKLISVHVGINVHPSLIGSEYDCVEYTETKDNEINLDFHATKNKSRELQRGPSSWLM